ncbi:MAG: hypothetical protein Salg2KO_06800 [Salibacteraceae bacterium]
MKKIIISAACLLFAATGFSQSADAKAEASTNAKSCAKGKPACCAHAAKSCGDKKGTAKAENPSDVAPDANATIIATDPKENKKAAADKASSAL